MYRLFLMGAALCALVLPTFAQAGEETSASSVVGSRTQPAETKKADKALARDVRRALGHTRGLNAQGVRVTARQGAVTLSGTVRTVDEMNTAEHVARNVRGVQAVANKLTLFRGENG
jgi:osmotically-inducible protein OsmY